MATIHPATDLPDATVIFFGDASNVTLNGSDVSQFDDLSGNGNHFVQATGGNQPVYNAANSSFNNKPTIDPVSASNEFMRASGLDLGTTFTVFVIGAKGGASEAWLSEDNTADDGYVGFDASSEPTIDNGATLTSSNAADTNPAVFEYRVNGTTSLIRDKAVQGASGTLGTANNWDDIYLFRRQDGSLGFDGSLAALLIIAGSATQADRRVVYQYANQRYGIAMPFPQTETPIISTGGGTTINVNMPMDVEAGDLLRVALSKQQSQGFGAASGWTQKVDSHTSAGFGDSSHLQVFLKVADGTEAGGTVAFTSAGGAASVAHCRRVRDWYGALAGMEASTPATGESAAPGASGLAVSWGAQKTLWESVASAGDDDVAFTAAPPSYGDLLSTITGVGSGSGSSVGSASRENVASSENAGAWTLASSERWNAVTLGIRPIARVPLSSGGAGIMAAGL